MKSNEVGVIMARFQVPELHAGHRYLINTVRSLHTEVCIVLGSTGGNPTIPNSLNTDVRRLMLQNEFPGVVVCEHLNRRDDQVWSEMLDELIESIFPGKEARLYGSRGSFIPSYHGRFPTEELKQIYLESGTHVRSLAADEPRDSFDFRAGVMYGTKHRYPSMYPAVDIAIVRPERREALLGHKRGDGKKYRFVGGMVDPTDESAEAAAKREAREEAGKNLNLGDFQFIGSARIDDPRYRGTPDKILSLFYRTNYLWGFAQASDDLDSVGWFPYDKIGENLVEEHYPLGALFNKHIRDTE
ncbi:NUDIX domain-containing protein [Candidatus Kaiserbacteria bacterium]|nr:NUDIX domain-containing protein [Candidatus Kaiserbacteria bacterium]